MTFKRYVRFHYADIVKIAEIAFIFACIMSS